MNARTIPSRLTRPRIISVWKLVPGAPRINVETSIGECSTIDIPAKARKFLFHTENVRLITEPTVKRIPEAPKELSAGSAMAIGGGDTGKA